MSQIPLVCALAQAWNQLVLRLLSEFPSERILVHLSVFMPCWPRFLSVGMVFEN